MVLRFKLIFIHYILYRFLFSYLFFFFLLLLFLYYIFFNPRNKILRAIFYFIIIFIACFDLSIIFTFLFIAI